MRGRVENPRTGCHPIATFVRLIGMRTALSLVPALLLVACLETEERIAVDADGSLRVTITVNGDRQDLSDGYPLPTTAPWQPQDEVTRAWLTAGERQPDAEGKLRVTVAADFATAADLPERYAPATDPYRTAYTARHTSLQIRRVGARTVYVFERRFAGRPPRPASWSDVERQLPQATRDKLADGRMPDAEEWSVITAAVRGAAGRFAEQMSRDACVGIYTDGDGELPLAALDRVVASCHERALAPFTVERLLAAYRWLLHRKAHPESPARPDPFRQFEQEMIDGLRAALGASLTTAGVPAAVRNAAQERFEWWLTAHNHTDDVADERFVVVLTMPGRIVDASPGAQIEVGSVRWTFAGSDLREGDRTLRVVSVVE